MKYNIPFNKPFIIGRELFYLARSVINGSISGNGFYTKACQDLIKDITRAEKVFMMPSCTAGLEMAMLLIGIEPGDEVIMPSYTFVSTANAVVLRGGVPVFCDIKEDDFNINSSKVEALLTNKTKAIIPVHYAGRACDMDHISKIASQHSVFVVEDAAQAFGSMYKGRQLGTIGDFGTFSFHETKNINCGEGGALLVNNPKFHQRAEIIQEKGTNRSQFFRGEIEKYTWVDIGSSYLPSELQMAFLLAQLERLTEINMQRQKLAEYYYIQLKALNGSHITLPNFPIGEEYNFHLFPILCANQDERSLLIEFFKTHGILAVFHYVPLHSSPAGKKFGRTPVELPVTDDISRRLVRLPLFHEMGVGQQDKVIKCLFSFYGKSLG